MRTCILHGRILSVAFAIGAYPAWRFLPRRELQLHGRSAPQKLDRNVKLLEVHFFTPKKSFAKNNTNSDFTSKFVLFASGGTSGSAANFASVRCFAFRCMFAQFSFGVRALVSAARTGPRKNRAKRGFCG